MGELRLEQVGDQLADYAIESARLAELRQAVEGEPLTVIGARGTEYEHPVRQALRSQQAVVRGLRRDLGLNGGRERRPMGRPIGSGHQLPPGPNPLRALQEQIAREGFDVNPDYTGSYPVEPWQAELSAQIRAEREAERRRYEHHNADADGR